MDKSAKPPVPGERLTRGSMIACVALAMVAPLFGDDPKGVVVPLLMASAMAGRLAWLRKDGAR